MQTRILIADDHRIVRQGVRTLLESQLGFTVAGEAADGAEAVEAAEELAPDLVLMDICMPRLSGIEATRRIVKPGVSTRVLMLTMLEVRSYVEEALRAGAMGYVVKSAPASELTSAIEAVRSGNSYLSPAVTQQVLGSIARPSGEPAAQSSALTEREREVLHLIAEGLSSREIAERIHLSSKTVETHRANLMDKLGIHKVAGLVRFAVRAGLVSP